AERRRACGGRGGRCGRQPDLQSVAEGSAGLLRDADQRIRQHTDRLAGKRLARWLAGISLCVTLTYPVDTKVYQPQADSRLLVEAMRRGGEVAGRRVLDLCTGSGFVAIAAAEMGCASVTAFDICPHAVRCSRDNAVDAGVDLDVRQGPWIEAFDCPPF